ncbi:hypothetical protein J8N05_12480 [Streptomyces sp. BH-SS-21]|uniref:Uncharacterized protein n=1 Tax=Streptomyces liliiviolaceus TaxID=2823109 RepID=A0A940XWE9_9ACTN|nr:hypothetical protein [Streptomyces liliiviolaceus]MBQ0849022.1 hypothetical protein [Streptomyces liliiviolaceus]
MPEYGGAEYEEAAYEGIDALLAALTDEPLPAGARDDPEFMAEHRSAVADVALLGEQLRIMGDTLADGPTDTGPTDTGATDTGATDPGRPGAGLKARPTRASAPLRPPGAPKKAPGPRRLRRYAGAAMGALVIAAGTALLGGLVWLGAQGGADSDAGSKSDTSAAKSEGGGDGGGDTSAYPPEMRLACSRILAEGTVRSIASTGDGNVRVVLEVKRYYRPEQSAADHPTVTVTLPEEAREDLRTGTYTLVRVPLYPRDGPDYETGRGVGDAREEILGALPGARGLECAGPEGGRG